MRDPGKFIIWGASSEKVSSNARIMRIQIILRNYYPGLCSPYILSCPMILLADSEGPDQTAHPRSLIWAFTVRICPKTCFRIARRIYEPQREKTYLLTCAPNEDSNQPADPRSLIRIFVVRTTKLCILGYPKCVQ